jgi:hypothetical protein
MAAQAADCRDTTFDGRVLHCLRGRRGEDLRLFHSGPDGAYGSFAT